MRYYKIFSGAVILNKNILASSFRLMDPDLVDVTTEHELKCEPNGIVHDVFRYIATWKNGISKEVSRRVYELWTNRKVSF